MRRNRGFCSCFLLLTLLGVTSSQSTGCGSSPCPQSNGLFPVPDDCTAFYNCAHCTAYRQQCGPGTAFDPQLRVCNHIHQVDCSGSESYSQRINERKQNGAASGASTHSGAHDATSGGAVAARSSLNRRYGSIEPVAPSGYESSTVPYPYQESRRFYGRDNTGAQIQPIPAGDIYQPEDGTSATNARAGHYTNENPQAGRPTDGRHGYHYQEPQKQREEVSARNIYQSGYDSSATNRSSSHSKNEDHYSGTNADSHHDGHHRNSQKSRGGAPVRDVYQSGERSQSTVSRSGHYTSQNQQNGRPLDSHNSPQRSHHQHHHHHHQESQEQYESSSNATDRGTVAVSTRSRFNHSHIAHHQEAVSYLPTHQIVYDHSHGEHHLGDHEHSDINPQDFSSNNRGSPQMRKNNTDAAHQTATESPIAQNSTDRDGAGFDLKDRFVANSGFVPSYVRDQMNDDTPSKVGNYGEREYVRSPNRRTEDSGIRNLQGKPINPDRFYTDDVSTLDTDSQESPVQLNADDLRHFQQNQAAQGIPFFEASSNADRQGRSSVIQPGFRSPYQYPAPSPISPLSSAASSPISSESARPEQSEKSGQLFVEHKRHKQHQDSAVSSSDSRGRSANDRASAVFDASESREHIVYVSAPALPTPLPLLADDRKKEYHHMGYRFDHDPLRETVKAA